MHYANMSSRNHADEQTPDNLSARTFSMERSACVPHLMGTGSLEIEGKAAQSFRYEVSKPVNGQADLTIDGVSTSDKVWAAIGFLGNLFRSKMAPLAATSALTVGATPDSAQAQIRPDGSNGQAYIDYGTQFTSASGSSAASRALSLQVNRPDGSSFFASAINIGNGYALTTGHAVVEGNSFSVATGNNYITNPGTVVSVASVVLSPQYTGANSRGDIAVLRLNGLYDTPLATFTSPQVNSVITAASFGKDGTPSGGLQNQDGNVRAFDSTVVANNGFNLPDNFVVTRTSPAFSVPMPGRLAPGGSGSPGGHFSEVNTNDFELSVLFTGGQLGSGFSGYSYGIDLGRSDTQVFIYSAMTPVPELENTLLLATAAGLCVVGYRKKISVQPS